MTTEVELDSAVDQQCAYLQAYVENAIAESESGQSSRGDVRIMVAPLGVHDALTTVTVDGPSDRPLGVFLYGRTAIIGPSSAARGVSSPCFHCVALRWQKLRSEEERNTLERSGTPFMPRQSPYLMPASCEIVAQVAESVVRSTDDGDGNPDSPAFVYEVELDSGRVSRFLIIADPDCAVCAQRPPDTPERATVTSLKSRRKRGVDVFRARSIHDYKIPVGAVANPVCGSLGRAALPDVTSTTTAPVTGYMFMRGSALLHEFFWSGHGDSYEDSVLLAIFEGLERYVGLHRRSVRDPLVDCYANIADHALDPRECGMYADEFYASQPTYFTEFSPDLSMPWVWAYSLRDKRPILVPERIVYYLGQDDSNNFVQECSNGCASGASFEEAVFHGLMELIERDAFLLGWYGKAALTEIDPSTCERRDVRLMIDRAAMAGYEIRLFDNRIDLPVPVVTAVAVRKDGGYGAVSFAAGASPDPESAVAAALCEIASYVPGFEERVVGQLDEATAMADDYYQVSELHHHPLIFGLPDMLPTTDFLLQNGAPARPMSEVYEDWNQTRPRSLDLLDDLEHCLGLLTERGYDVIVADQTSTEQEQLGVHTAAVIVPGLIPIDFGWGKQRVLRMPRMRTAFRDAGWRDTPLDPAELNLVPHPFP